MLFYFQYTIFLKILRKNCKKKKQPVRVIKRSYNVLYLTSLSSFFNSSLLHGYKWWWVCWNELHELKLHSDLLLSIAEIPLIYWRQNFTHGKLSLYVEMKANNTWKKSLWTANKSFRPFTLHGRGFSFTWVFSTILEMWTNHTFSHSKQNSGTIQKNFRDCLQAIQLTKSAHSDKPIRKPCSLYDYKSKNSHKE